MEQNELMQIGTMQKSNELSNLFEYILNKTARDIQTLTIDLDYFIYGILDEKKSNIYKRIENSMTTPAINNISEVFREKLINKSLRAVKDNRKPIIETSFEEYIIEGEKEAKEMGSNELSSEHIFLAILKNNDETNKIKRLFNKVGITYDILKDKMNEPIEDKMTEFIRKKVLNDNPNPNIKFKIINNDDDVIKNFLPGMSTKPKGKNFFISQYCVDVNEKVKNGEIDKLVGRKNETDEIIRILGKRKKNNVIIVGPEGVGKTALAENIAYKIENCDVPDFLIGKHLVSLDMTSLMAGTTLRGMFEERVKGIIEDIKANKSTILFIDNIGAILADNGKNDYDISSMLSHSLENGEIQVIGTSDFKNYRKTFDKDPSLARRFYKMNIEAPSVEESITILKEVANTYENFHNVKYSDEAIETCVKASNQFLTERNLPDSAIDVIDECGSYYGTVIGNEDLISLRKKIKELEKEVADGPAKQNSDASFDLLVEKLKSTRNNYSTLKKKIEKEKKENPYIIGKNEILQIISNKTGIEVQALNNDDKKHLVDMNNRIKSEVIGQDEAVDKLCRAIKRNKIGLRKNGCMFSGMFIGKTGVGKTYIAKKLAKELFGDENALIRLDMSEYSDKMSSSKLIGSSPGYVGYEDGGILTEKIKNKKYCVLLVDEIEKANSEVYNIFLQILDEGFLSDNSGMRVDFKNVIVLFTSNVGAKNAADYGKGVGFNEDVSANEEKILLKSLKNKFSPEFLNRVDEIIYFNALTNDDFKKIIRLELDKLCDNFRAISYTLTYDDSIIDHIFDKVKNEKEYGARPIKRAIQTIVGDTITDELLMNEYELEHTFFVSYDNVLNKLLVA